MLTPASPRQLLRMTEEEYAGWAFQQSFESEWVDGEVVIMAPVSGEHDQLQSWLRRLLETYVEKRDLGMVFGPQFQVRLARPSRREPDILFVDKSRLHLVKATFLDGPPDLALEIVSPSSESRDWRDKYLEYQATGVGEYWIIDPPSQQLEAAVLRPDRTYGPIEQIDGKLPSTVVPGWYLKPAWLWQPRPNFMDALAELGVR
jgi:Uma2 family endonuclease